MPVRVGSGASGSWLEVQDACEAGRLQHPADDDRWVPDRNAGYAGRGAQQLRDSGAVHEPELADIEHQPVGTRVDDFVERRLELVGVGEVEFAGKRDDGFGGALLNGD